MRSNPAKNLLLVVFGVALAACTSEVSKLPEPNIFPANYKQEILDAMTPILVDPTNVREAMISEPVLAPGNRDQRYSLCVRYNPRGYNREYLGVTERIAYFFAGRLNQVVEAEKGQCAKALYKPFPELEKLCLAKSCE